MAWNYWQLIDLKMEAVQTSEALANLYQSTRSYNPEDSHLLATCCINAINRGMFQLVFLSCR
jgi:hypothetical protein